MLSVNPHDIDRLTESVHLLLNGKKTQPLVPSADMPDNELRQLYGYFNRLIESYDQMADFIYALSRGELEYNPPKGNLVILQSFKSLQANLKHLTWVTQQIAKGEFQYRVDFMGDFSHAFNDMTRQLQDAFEQIQTANETICQDKERIDVLLHSILPDRVIRELEDTGRSTPTTYDPVTVFFSDIVGFTNQSSKIDPVMLIDELNSMFTAFDQIVSELNGERIKTIGDAFMAAWGLNIPVEKHAEMAVEAAMRILDFIRDRNSTWVLQWEVRIGLHCGSVVGGVVGNTKFIYDIFGDTVNTASRMESCSEPMRINVSEAIYHLIKDSYITTERGSIYVKGKGDCRMYFVEGRRCDHDKTHSRSTHFESTSI